MVAHWATSPQYLVAQTCFLVVPGVRTLDLSGPGPSIYLIHHRCMNSCAFTT